MALQPLPGTYSLDKPVSLSCQNLTKNAIPDRTGACLRIHDHLNILSLLKKDVSVVTYWYVFPDPTKRIYI